ncbi:MAG: pyrroline-5-carboxylate reductase [Cryomorphaceae bacterium]|nr:pyrroline-5-carboxylate reductase [Cryomorphaceae bacterium]
MKLLVVGAGNMGLTYSQGMAHSGWFSRRKLMIYDISAEITGKLKKDPNYDVYEKIEDCISIADIVFIAIKPYHAEKFFASIKPLVREDQIFVSLMAGVKIKTIQEQLGISKVVRTMPNLPAKVGKGITSYTESSTVSKVELILIRNLLDTTGESIHVDDETFIDKSTGISGSGPAYVFYFMQSMMEAAKRMGFSDHDAKVLVQNTFEGAIELFSQSDLTPVSWMKRVASKGGTTQAALDSMDDNNVKERIQEAAYAAFNRAVELGKEQ